MYPRRVEPEDGRLIVMSPNDFPYWFEDGMRHDVIWSSQGVVTETEVHRLAQMNLPGREIIWYANPPHLKSVPEIDRVHGAYFRVWARVYMCVLTSATMRALV